MTDILLMLDRWKIEIKREGNKARMVHEEWFYKKNLPKEHWDMIVENIKRVVSDVPNIKVREWTETDDEMHICIELEGNIKNIASGIAMEFLPLSKVRDIKLSEITEYATIGAVTVNTSEKIKIEEQRDEAEKAVERLEKAREEADTDE